MASTIGKLVESIRMSNQKHIDQGAQGYGYGYGTQPLFTPDTERERERERDRGIFKRYNCQKLRTVNVNYNSPAVSVFF